MGPRFALVLLLCAIASTARANPLEDGTRISLFAGAREVPHGHFTQLARDSGYPVSASWPVSPEALLSFAYAPQSSAEISIELGYASDQYTLPSSTLEVMSIPIVLSLRYFPLEPGRLSPYVGGGGGYLLGFVSGGPTQQSEAHAREFHLCAGLTYELSPRYLLSLEDRFQLASSDILPIGQIQTGGNVVMLGLSIVLAPEQPIAPHAPINLR